MANPRGYPPKSGEFDRRQRAAQDCFDYYRTVGDGNWNHQARRYHIVGRTQPVQSYTGPGFPQPGSQAADDLVAQADLNYAQFRLGAQNASVPRAAQLFTRETLNAGSFRQHLRDVGLRFVKVLGWVSRVSSFYVLTKADRGGHHRVGMVWRHYGMYERRGQIPTQGP